MVKIIYCIVKGESRECEILKTAFKGCQKAEISSVGGKGRGLTDIAQHIKPPCIASIVISFKQLVDIQN